MLSPALGWHPGHAWAPRSPPSASTDAVRGEAQPPRPRAERTAGPRNAPEAAPLRGLPRAVQAASPPLATRAARQKGHPRAQSLPNGSHPYARHVPRKLDTTGAEAAGAQAEARTTLPVRLRGGPGGCCAGARTACVAASAVLERCCGSARAPC